MGFFTGLDAEAYDRQYSDLDLLRRALAYIGAYRRDVIIMSTALFITAAIGAAQPIFVSYALDQLALNTTAEAIIWIAAALFGFGFMNWVGNFFRARYSSKIIGNVVLALRRDAFQAAVSHDLSFYDQYKSGRVISRITYDTQELGNVTRIVTDIISQFGVVIVLLGVLFTTEWRLTIALLIFLPSAFLVGVGFRNLARYVTRQGTRAMGNVNSSIQEAVTGISVAKNFRQESRIYGEFVEINKQSYRINLWRGFVIANVFPVLNALAGVGTALLLYLGGRVASGPEAAITAGAWFLFLQAVERFWFPIINLSAFWSQFQAGLSALERIFALIDAPHAVNQTASQPITIQRGEVVFDHVNFRYSDQEQVLRDFSLHIQPGESIALVGHTGAGKSSIVKLLARFYEFQQGQLTIDGQDIRTLELHRYRQQLGIVSQIPFLFNGSVADNIRYARPEVTDEEILRVAQLIGEGEWLDTLPNGIHSEVGERGNRLSMGQRQLVALTRVLVQKPAIFILDEATASVDPFTESQIQAALNLIMANSTSIIIAHRLSTVRSADRIIVLRKGEIIEQGNHQSLLNQGGHYAELYNTYFRHQSLEYIENARRLLEDSDEVVLPG